MGRGAGTAGMCMHVAHHAAGACSRGSLRQKLACVSHRCAPRRSGSSASVKIRRSTRRAAASGCRLPSSTSRAIKDRNVSSRPGQVLPAIGHVHQRVLVAVFERQVVARCARGQTLQQVGAALRVAHAACPPPPAFARTHTHTQCKPSARPLPRLPCLSACPVATAWQCWRPRCAKSLGCPRGAQAAARHPATTCVQAAGGAANSCLCTTLTANL